MDSNSKSIISNFVNKPKGKTLDSVIQSPAGTFQNFCEVNSAQEAKQSFPNSKKKLKAIYNDFVSNTKIDRECISFDLSTDNKFELVVLEENRPVVINIEHPIVSFSFSSAGKGFTLSVIGFVNIGTLIQKRHFCLIIA